MECRNDYDGSKQQLRFQYCVLTQAFGSNQVHVGGGVYAIWSGDITNGINAGVQGKMGLSDKQTMIIWKQLFSSLPAATWFQTLPVTG